MTNFINLSVRFKNPTWVLSFATSVISFVYVILGMFEVVPPISQDMIIQVISAIVAFLTGVGVMIDPTTKGVKDSEQALSYTEPKA